MQIIWDVLYAAFIALCFDLWPIMGKVLKAGPWSALLTTIGTSAAIIYFAPK